MLEFGNIVWNVIAPIFFLIGVGWLVQKKVGLDTRTLTRLSFWLFTPAFLFVHILDSKLSSGQLLLITAHFCLLFAMMWALTWIGASLLGLNDRLKRALAATVLFYNSGNYGVPVARFAFEGVGEAVQAVAIMLQNITNFSVGLGLVAGGEGRSRRQTLKAIFGLPMVYTLLAAWAWRATQLPLPTPLDKGAHLLSDALPPVALVTLGAQMATLRSYRFSAAMGLSLGLRLVIAPILGLALVWILGLHGVLAQAVIVSTSFPTAVNAALICIEFDTEPDFAAATVFYSTLVSSVTVSLVIYAVKHLPFLQS